MKPGIKRAYDEPGPDDGLRVLADRLWPRGMTKEAAHIDEWPKEVTPSTELRKWYHADPEARRAEFAERYRAELAEPDARAGVERLRALAAEQRLTFVTAAKDIEHSHVPILIDELG